MRAPIEEWAAEDGKTLIGVVHLEPLPGAPRCERPLIETIDRAIEDALAWRGGGADAVLVENFGDAPFFPGRVPPETIAAMTACARAVGEAVDLPLGVNVLRNDGEASLAVAAAAGGAFIRVNVLTHAYATDQGILEGIAHDLLRKRKALAAPVSILADVLVKHASPVGEIDPVMAARETLERGGADGIVLSGEATGEPLDPALLERVAGAAPEIPLFVGSGLTPENAGDYLGRVRGFLVGTWCETGGRTDGEKVRGLVRALAKEMP